MAEQQTTQRRITMTNKVINIEKYEEEKSKKKGTKITAIVILGVVFVLALFILISSFASVGLNPGFVAKPDLIQIYEQGKQQSSGTITNTKADEEKYNDFMKYYDEMFSSSFLSALFNGRLSGYSIKEDTIKSTSTLTSGFENAYVKFSYDSPIVLTYKNGSEYKYKNDSTKSVTFEQIFFEIKEENTLQEFTFYVIDLPSTQTEGNIKYYTVSLAANTSDLHENLDDFLNGRKA